MDSLLSVLAMVAGLLVLGWLIGSDEEQVAHARATEEPATERSPAPSGSIENR